MKKVAAFDFDGTLTYRDTLIPFLRTVLGVAGLALALVRSFRALAMYAFGRLSNEVAKQSLIKSALRGRGQTALRSIAKDWMVSISFRQEMLDRLKWHREMGHYCVMVSASPDIYLEEIASWLGFDELICTQLEVDQNGDLTGSFATPNCWGGEKVRRLVASIGPLEQVELYAYGDSAGDFPMLDAANHARLKNRPYVKCNSDSKSDP